MEITVKYVVLTEDHAAWIIENTRAQYRELFGDHPEYADIESHLDRVYEPEPFIKSHNDFSKQMLMAFEGDIALASAELISLLPEEEKPEESSKPLLFHKVIHNTGGKGLPELLERAEQIARQRKHDALVVKTWKTRDTAQKIIRNAGFETLKTGTVTIGKATLEQSFFMKKIE